MIVAQPSSADCIKKIIEGGSSIYSKNGFDDGTSALTWSRTFGKTMIGPVIGRCIVRRENESLR